jgi:hypothetical protein
MSNKTEGKLAKMCLELSKMCLELSKMCYFHYKERKPDLKKYDALRASPYFTVDAITG